MVGRVEPPDAGRGAAPGIANGGPCLPPPWGPRVERRRAPVASVLREHRWLWVLAAVAAGAALAVLAGLPGLPGSA
jgi:hypothetical protein